MSIRHCQIHFTEPARSQAAAAVFPYAGVPVYDVGADSNRREFTGPHFHGIRDITVSEGTVDVTLEDGTLYLYPLHSVARIKVYTTEGG